MFLERLLVRLLNLPRHRMSPAKGIYLGQSERLVASQGQQPFTLSPKPIQHTFISGRTGSGKTTLLLRLMHEHVRAGLPFVFVDFHGPATDELLATIAVSGQQESLILLEPWADPVVGWNPLDAGSESVFTVVQELVEIFHRRLWPDAWGPRLEELLRMTLLALSEAELTLVEASTFLTQVDFRRAILSRIKSSDVREFWHERFERMSPSQRSLVSEAVLNKVSVFAQDIALKYVVGQQQGTLDLDLMFRQGRTLLANLSTGKLAGANRFLLASLLVAKMKGAVYRRPPDAKGYAIFLDEFQEMVALETLDDYLRSFRKFGCAVYLATQQLDLAPELKAAVFGNCARFFAFAASAADAALLGKEFGGIDGALAAEMLPELPVGQACVKVRGEPVQLLKVAKPDRPIGKAIPRDQVLHLGASRQSIEAEIAARRARIRFIPKSAADGAEPGNAEMPEGYDEF